MQLKVHQVERVYKKLEMLVKATHHKMAYFYVDGKLILKTRLSQGGGDAKAPQKIRCDFKLNEDDFKNLVDCPLSREKYILILKEKGYI